MVTPLRTISLSPREEEKLFLNIENKAEMYSMGERSAFNVVSLSFKDVECWKQKCGSWAPWGLRYPQSVRPTLEPGQWAKSSRRCYPMRKQGGRFWLVRSVPYDRSRAGEEARGGQRWVNKQRGKGGQGNALRFPFQKGLSGGNSAKWGRSCVLVHSERFSC